MIYIRSYENDPLGKIAILPNLVDANYRKLVRNHMNLKIICFSVLLILYNCSTIDYYLFFQWFLIRSFFYCKDSYSNFFYIYLFFLYNFDNRPKFLNLILFNNIKTVFLNFLII